MTGNSQSSRFRVLTQKLFGRVRSQPLHQASPGSQPLHSDATPPLDGNPSGVTPHAENIPEAVPSGAPVSDDPDSNAIGTQHATLASHNVEQEDTAADVHHPEDDETLQLSDQTLPETVAHSDVWSKAFQEALKNMGDDIDATILDGESAQNMFRELEKLCKTAGEGSAASIVELASPLGAINPVASTALGVVKSVVTIAVNLAAADMEFAKHVAEMLHHIRYIDDCDTFGRKTEDEGIHDALVQVYQKLLEFYQAVHSIVMKKGVVLVLKIMVQNESLPQIMDQFVKKTELLRRAISNATAKKVADLNDMVTDQQIFLWLGKLSDQSAYHSSLKDLTAPEACSYLETDEQVVQWYSNETCQKLAIVGDTGFGKSFSMSFLIEFLTKQNQTQVPAPKLCYYFCRDDATGNLTSILSGLILSLLSQLKGLRKVFAQWYQDIQRDNGIPDPAADAGSLVSFLRITVKSLDRPLQFVIDGLDECERKSRTRLISILVKLAEENSRFKYLLSSRPHEEIMELLGDTCLLRIRSSLERDTAIVNKVVDMTLPHLKENVKQLIREKLPPLAQGSGIWIRMVVASIESKGIKAASPMREFLKDLPLPSNMSELYRTILERYTANTEENKAFAHIALEVLAAARRNLSISELTCAVILGTAPESTTTVSDVETFIDTERVMGLIQPFIFQVEYQKKNERQIKLVHQSVREFIVTDDYFAGLRNRGNAERPSTRIVGQRIDGLERTILNICIRHLLLDDIAAQALFSSTQIAAIVLPQETDLFSDDDGPNTYTAEIDWDIWEEDMTRYDPTERGFGEFFVYAASFWIEHLGHVTQEPLPAIGDLEKLCQAKSIRLDNWTLQNCRPGCAIQARYEFDGELYDPLSIIALYGSDAILYHLLNNADFGNGSYLGNSPMAAADQVFQWGDLSRLKILLSHADFKDQLHSLEFFRMMLQKWHLVEWRHDNWNEAFDLVSEVFTTMVTGQWGNELLCIAANMGCMPIIERLMNEAGVNPLLKAELWRAPCRDTLSPYGHGAHQSVGEAVQTNRVDVLKYLLQQDGVDAHLRHVSARGKTVLHVVPEICDPAIIKMLVERLGETRALPNEGMGIPSANVKPSVAKQWSKTRDTADEVPPSMATGEKPREERESLDKRGLRRLHGRGTWTTVRLFHSPAQTQISKRASVEVLIFDAQKQKCLSDSDLSQQPVIISGPTKSPPKTSQTLMFGHLGPRRLRPTTHMITMVSAEGAAQLAVGPLPADEARWIKLVKIDYRDQTGKERTWESAERRSRPKDCDIDGVGIIAVLERPGGQPKEIVLQKQYRPPIDRVSLEVPAGLIDAGETAEQAAVRELREETGYVGVPTETSPMMFNDPGFCNTNLRMVHMTVDMSLPANQNPQPQLEDDEFIEVFTHPLEGLWDLCKKLEAEGIAIDARVGTLAEGVLLAQQFKL
ncbi:hypothetical protein PWT90_10410 [Aphanocladium album]|nr:hypothetical protein PWT90_10410 [Aphanocladium album]